MYLKKTYNKFEISTALFYHFPRELQYEKKKAKGSTPT